MAKGITEVIAIILLLLITIAVIGFATGFFQTIVQTSGQQAASAANITGDRLQKVVAYITSTADSVTVQNIGTSTMTAASDLTVFVAGAPKTCSWSAPAIAPGATSTCTITTTGGNDCVPSGSVIALAAPGNTDSSGKCP